MSRNHDRRPSRRAAVPALATLEDRRLMTGGLNPAAAAVPMTPQAFARDSAVPAFDAATPRTLEAYASDSSLPAHDAAAGKDWIAMGSEARFGPEGLYLLSGGNAWPTSPPSSTPADPSTPQGKLDAAFAKQSADVQAVQDKSEVTPRMLATLRSAREKAVAEAGTADPALVEKLRAGIDAARASGAFSDAQQAQLKADYAAALKSAGVSDATTAGLFAAEDAVWAASHVTADDLKTLAADQAAVQTLLDSMPVDAVAFGAGAGYAASARGAGAGNNAATLGKPSPGERTPGRDLAVAPKTGTPIASRPSSVDPGASFARVSRRLTNATAGRFRGVAENVGANGRRFAANLPSVPSTIVRKLPNFRGMRTFPTTARP